MLLYLHNGTVVSPPGSTMMSFQGIYNPSNMAGYLIPEVGQHHKSASQLDYWLPWGAYVFTSGAHLCKHQALQ